MTRYVLNMMVAVVILAMLAGCSTPGSLQIAEQRQKIDTLQLQKKEQTKNLRATQLHQGYYLGAGAPLPLSNLENLPPIFKQSISVRQSFPSIDDAIALISKVTKLNVEVASLKSQNAVSDTTDVASADSGLVGLDTVTSATETLDTSITPDTSETWIRYSGNVAGFLDALTSKFNVSWEYTGGVVRVFKWKTKTYQIASVPGKVTSSTTMSSTTTSSDASQEYKTESSVSIWDDLKENVAKLLSVDGTVTVDQSSSSITVYDLPAVIRDIDQYVTTLNKVLSRQVAIDVNVYNLTLSDSAGYGFDLDAVFETAMNDFKITLDSANPVSSLNGFGTLTSAILASSDPNASKSLQKWVGSQAFVQALSTQGSVSLVTTGSGITLNDQPMPIQDIRSRSYLESLERTKDPDTGEITTSTQVEKLVTGFSMTVTPHILENNQVLVQCALSLAALNSFNTTVVDSSTLSLPDTNTRSFVQRSAIKSGTTLILAAFQSDTNDADAGSGLLSFWKNGQSRKSVVIVTLSANLVDGAGV